MTVWQQCAESGGYKVAKLGFDTKADIWARPLARPRDGDQQMFFALYASQIRTPHERRTQLHQLASPGGGLARGRAPSVLFRPVL